MPARDALGKQMQRFLDQLTVERGLSPHTIAAYRRDLERYAAFLRERGITDGRRVDETAVAAHVASVSASTHDDGRPYRATSVVRALSSVRARPASIRPTSRPSTRSPCPDEHVAPAGMAAFPGT